MKLVKVNDLKIGDVVGVKEPQQKFSFDTYTYNGMATETEVSMILSDEDGREILFPLDELSKCLIWHSE